MKRKPSYSRAVQNLASMVIVHIRYWMKTRKDSHYVFQLWRTIRLTAIENGDAVVLRIIDANRNSYEFMTARNSARMNYIFLGVFGVATLFDKRKVAALLKIMQDIVKQHISGALGLPAVILVSENSWNDVLPQ